MNGKELIGKLNKSRIKCAFMDKGERLIDQIYDNIGLDNSMTVYSQDVSGKIKVLLIPDKEGEAMSIIQKRWDEKKLPKEKYCKYIREMKKHDYAVFLVE